MERQADSLYANARPIKIFCTSNALPPQLTFSTSATEVYWWHY
jgi:hypothetical protein